MSFHRLVVTAALAAWIAAATPAALAVDNARGGALAVDSVDVEQVGELAAGVPLNFSVYGTPRAAALLRIEGGARALVLRETEPGVYEGTYVIDARDAIGPGSRVVATLRRGDDVAQASLEESLLLAKGPLPWAEAAAEAEAQTSPPTALPAPNATPTPSPSVATTPRTLPVPVAPPVLARAAERAACDDCAVVESVRVVPAAPAGGAIGAIAGAIAGAVLGNELGEAHTRRMLRVLGAIGGALTGREIEREATRGVRYDVVLRLADGSTQTRRFDRAPPFAPGETIRLGGAALGGAPGGSPF